VVPYDTQALARWSLRELDGRNTRDCEIKAKICGYCENPQSVRITRTATQDLGLIPLTKDAVLEIVKEHITLKRRVFTDRMDNGDTAYIIEECTVEETNLYVKVRFFKQEDGAEAMLIISAHPPRRW
jgi:hypothetical protein